MTVRLQNPARGSMVEVTVIISSRCAEKYKPAIAVADAIDIDHTVSEMYPTKHIFRVACWGATVAGVKSAREQLEQQHEFVITSLKGRHLHAECTIGFAFAAQLAALRAVDSTATVEEANLYGWMEKK